jgi:hypothetical protein
MTRRFPPPWTVEEQSACYVVRDHNGHSVEGHKVQLRSGIEDITQLVLFRAAQRLWWPCIETLDELPFAQSFGTYSPRGVPVLPSLFLGVLPDFNILRRYTI